MKIMITVAILSMASISQGQGISGGIKSGLNLATYRGLGSGGIEQFPKMVERFHGGFYLTMMVSKHFGFQPELLFSAQGSEQDVSGNMFTLHVDYIQVPVLARLNIGRVVSLHAGPQIGVNTSAKGFYGNAVFNYKNNYKNTDFNVVFGTTINLPLKLHVTARYCLGVYNTRSHDYITQKNNTLQFSIGYRMFDRAKNDLTR